MGTADDSVNIVWVFSQEDFPTTRQFK